MINQIENFYCPGCKKVFHVIVVNPGFYAVLYQCEDIHNTISPECNQSVLKIRTLDMEKILNNVD